MKKYLSTIMLVALSLGLQAADLKVEFRRMAEGTSGNQRSPMIAENSFGERIYTYRGSDRYAHYLYYRNGTWTGSNRVPGSPIFDAYWYSDIVADSTGTFHYVCEEADASMFYASFQDGKWTPMRKIDIRHEATLALGVRSNDTIVLAAPFVTRDPKGITKDVLLGTKSKGASNFSGFKNVTHDIESSTMVDVAIDAQDNTWISYKGSVVKGASETLQIILLGLNNDSKEIDWKNVSGQEGAWCWYPRVAVNSDGQIMVTWMVSQLHSYFYRLYDRPNKKWNEVKAIAYGPTSPWPLMYNKLLARGQDFFWIGMNGSRVLSLYRYDAKNDDWDNLGDVSQGGVNWFSACNAAGSILISWESMTTPASCYLTTVTVKPVGPLISGKVSQGSKGIGGVALTGLPTSAATDNSGNYRTNVPSGWTGTVIPRKSGYRFEPSSKPYDKVTTDQTGQNYTAITQFNLIISATSGGTTAPPPATYPKDVNTPVTVAGVPNPNYQFAYWSGDASGDSNPMTLTMDKNKTIRANFIRIRIKPVVNLNVTKRVERSFFGGYTLNALTWAANPENAAMGLTVSAQIVYRKARTEDKTKWARIADLAGTVLNYEDRKIPKDSDYVYAVACVDDKGNVSPIIGEGQGASAKAGVPERHFDADRMDR